jgi:uncharacterized protein YeaO (DUF488 family)
LPVQAPRRKMARISPVGATRLRSGILLGPSTVENRRMSFDIQVARVYDPPKPGDGTRMLVDRLWPRGVPKGAVDQWCRLVAPSHELRKWYGHDPDLFAEFARRYRVELDDPERSAGVAKLREICEQGPLTLLTATTVVDVSHATVLAGLIPLWT